MHRDDQCSSCRWLQARDRRPRRSGPWGDEIAPGGKERTRCGEDQSKKNWFPIFLSTGDQVGDERRHEKRAYGVAGSFGGPDTSRPQKSLRYGKRDSKKQQKRHESALGRRERPRRRRKRCRGRAG